jgi:hypothetical protein
MNAQPVDREQGRFTYSAYLLFEIAKACGVNDYEWRGGWCSQT